MSAWPGPCELRVGLGCMRLSTDEDRDEERALATIAAAAAGAGITVFDTARAYGLGEPSSATTSGCWRARCAACGATAAARIVTKGGMARPAAPGSRTAARRRSAPTARRASTRSTASPIDLYLLHAPDPRTPWPTIVRALARLADEGLVRRVGVANVNRRQLDEALELAPIAAVQVALSPFDDRAAARRGGRALCRGRASR